jgi:predicted Rossmann-fold nucleotide-binding protein
MNYSICVSGAAAGKTVIASRGLAERLGTAIAKSGHIITTGATVGLPYYAARAAKQAGGMSIGFSPASSLREHMYKYRLPIGVFDFVNFTGMHYIGRDIHLVQSYRPGIINDLRGITGQRRYRRSYTGTFGEAGRTA